MEPGRHAYRDWRSSDILQQMSTVGADSGVATDTGDTRRKAFQIDSTASFLHVDGLSGTQGARNSIMIGASSDATSR